MEITEDEGKLILHKFDAGLYEGWELDAPEKALALRIINYFHIDLLSSDLNWLHYYFNLSSVLQNQEFAPEEVTCQDTQQGLEYQTKSC
jgi:hypothetical protein